MKFTCTEKEARDILWGGHEDFTDFQLDTIIEVGRWTVLHDLIVQRKSDDKFFRTSYRCGATETQDQQPFEYEGTVTFVEVKPVEKTVIVYE